MCSFKESGGIGLPNLKTKELGQTFFYLNEVDSTNNYLKNNANKLPHGAAVAAGHQHSGRGRGGNSWSTGRGQALALSVLLKNNINMQDIGLLPLLAGLAVCQALEAVSGCVFLLKWSNDVLCENKKICGVLCESRLSPQSGAQFAVLGIGVNLRQKPEDFARFDLLYATSLQIATRRVYAPETVAAAILCELERELACLGEKGPEHFLPRYREKCATLGKQVRILGPEGEIKATAVDVGETGELICKGCNGDSFAVNAGEVSVRGLYGYC